MKKHSKETVIKIGEELFRSQGYHNTGTETILQKSDYPRSSFYYHFKNKEGFALQVLDYYGGRVTDFYNNVLTDQSIGSSLQRLEAFNQYYGR